MLASQTSVPNTDPLLHTALGDDSESTATEQHVTYSDGTARMEMVHNHPQLEIDYWRANGNGPWYFEDPITGAVTKAGSDKKLRKALTKRNFWWLETDEDVTVTRNRDGSKSYEYKGLTDPLAITELLDAESKQAELDADKPVSKWTAATLAGMSLLGNLGGLQTVIKSQVSRAEPESPEPQGNNTTADVLRMLNNPAPVSSQAPENPADFAQGSFFNVEYFADLSLCGLQMASTILAGATAVVRPGMRQESSAAPLGLMAMLMQTKVAGGYMVRVEQQPEDFASGQDFAKPMTSSRTFNVQAESFHAHSSEPGIIVPAPVVHSKPEQPVTLPAATTAQVGRNAEILTKRSHHAQPTTAVPESKPSVQRHTAPSTAVAKKPLRKGKPISVTVKKTVEDAKTSAGNVTQPMVLPQNTTSNSTNQTAVPHIPVVHLPKHNQIAQAKPQANLTKAKIAKPLVLAQNTTSNVTHTALAPVQKQVALPAQKPVAQLEQKTMQVLTNQQAPVQGASQALVLAKLHGPGAARARICSDYLRPTYDDLNNCNLAMTDKLQKDLDEAGYNYYVRGFMSLTDEEIDIMQNQLSNNSVLEEELVTFFLVNKLLRYVGAAIISKEGMQEGGCPDELKDTLKKEFYNTQVKLNYTANHFGNGALSVDLDCVNGLRNGTFAPEYEEPGSSDESSDLTIGLGVGIPAALATIAAASALWHRNEIANYFGYRFIPGKWLPEQIGEDSGRMIPSRVTTTSEPEYVGGFNSMKLYISSGRGKFMGENIGKLKGQERSSIRISGTTTTVGEAVKVFLQEQIGTTQTAIAAELPDGQKELQKLQDKLNNHQAKLGRIDHVVEQLSLSPGWKKCLKSVSFGFMKSPEEHVEGQMKGLDTQLEARLEAIKSLLSQHKAVDSVRKHISNGGELGDIGILDTDVDKTLAGDVKRFLQTQVAAIQQVIDLELPATQQELERLKPDLLKAHQKLDRIISVVQLLSNWNWRDELTTTSLQGKQQRLNFKIQKLEMRLIPAGVDSQTCEDIIDADDVAKLYYYYAFYGGVLCTYNGNVLDLYHSRVGIAPRTQGEKFNTKASAADGVIYYGPMTEIGSVNGHYFGRVNSQPNGIVMPDGGIVYAWFKYEEGVLEQEEKNGFGALLNMLPLDRSDRFKWSYGNNQAFWCGAMMAGRKFVQIAPAYNTPDDKAKQRDHLSDETTIETDELLWLWQNGYKVFSSGGKMELSPPSTGFSPNLSTLKLVDYTKENTHDPKKIKIQFLLDHTLFKEPVRDFERVEDEGLYAQPEYRV